MESFDLTSLERRFLEDLFGSTSLAHELEGNGSALRPGVVKLVCVCVCVCVLYERGKGCVCCM